MARAPDGLTRQQAGLLLRCQTLREARLRAEHGRSAAATAEAEARRDAAGRSAEQHVTDGRAVVRRAYEALTGQAVDPLAVLAARATEDAVAERQEELWRAKEGAQSTLESARAGTEAAQSLLLAAGRTLSRRQRMHDAIASEDARRETALEERGAEDAHLAQRAAR